jgi:hypothetical protein
MEHPGSLLFLLLLMGHIAVRYNFQDNIRTPTYTVDHGLINYKDTISKCRLYWFLIEFTDWRYSQSCWYFRPSFVKYCPANPLSNSSPTSSPFQSQSTVQCIQTLCVWERVRVLSPLGDHILLEFNTLFPTRFRTYIIALPPQPNKNQGGEGGLRQINTCRNVPLHVNLFR